MWRVSYHFTFFVRDDLQQEVNAQKATNQFQVVDPNLAPVVSERKSEYIPPDLEGADRNFTDYMYMQFLGDDVETESELDEDYQSKLDFFEVILDDFS